MTAKNAAPAARTGGPGQFFDRTGVMVKAFLPISFMPQSRWCGRAGGGASLSKAKSARELAAQFIALDLFLVEIFNPGLRSVLRPEPRRGSKTNN